MLVIGLSIPTINPRTGIFDGGIRTNYDEFFMGKRRGRFVDRLDDNPSEYNDDDDDDDYERQSNKNKKFKNRSQSKDRFKSIVIFGDSYSDTGNVYNLTSHTWPIVPPFYDGRFCNGPNWVDQLGKSYLLNYAYGGATTDNNFVQGLTKLNTVPIPGLRQQIAMYSNTINKNRIRQSDILYILWGGNNDFLFNNALTAVQIVNSLMNCVQDLIGIGAKYFLIFNQVPAQLLPEIKALNQNAFFTELVRQGNDAVNTSLKTIQQNNPKTYFYIFDINRLITKVTSDAKIFLNTVDPCWNEVNLTYIQIFCKSSSKYVFIDDLHFSDTVHQFIADAIKPFLSSYFKLGRPDSYIYSPK